MSSPSQGARIRTRDLVLIRPLTDVAPGRYAPGGTSQLDA